MDETNDMVSYLEEGKLTYGLRERIKRFVPDVWDFCDELPSSPSGRNVNYQLMRSASSVGANFRAAFRARSDKEYIAKLGICEEESDETCYWLDLCRSRPKWKPYWDRASELHEESDQLTAIIVSLIKKKKATMRS